MAMGRTLCVALVGIDGHLVEVEADVASGLPAFTITGLPDTALGQARDRVRAASANSGAPVPMRRGAGEPSPPPPPETGIPPPLPNAPAGPRGGAAPPPPRG